MVNRKKQDIIFIIVVVIIILIGWFLVDGLKEYDVNRLGQLKYNMTESDEDPLVAVDIDENEGIVTGKEYALAKNFSEVKVVISPYSTYEQAVAKNSAYKYSDYHNYTDNNNPGINSIICGILEEGGAMAWICTNCGTYTMRVTNVASNDVTNTAYNDKICEEKLHSLLSEVSIDESLTDEVRK